MPWGEVPGMTIDKNGIIYAFTGTNRPWSSSMRPGKGAKTWGKGMFVWPHGIRFDRDGNLWITDGRAADGNGQMVYKFDLQGKLLMTLGTKGVSGEVRTSSTASPTSRSRPMATSSCPTAT